MHLEVAFGMDTYLFLNTFCGMINRMGLRQDFLRQRGYVVGADIELRELVMKLDKDEIQKSAANKSNNISSITVLSRKSQKPF